MQLQSAEMGILEVRPGHVGDEAFEARVQLRRVGGGGPVSGRCPPDWVTLTPDRNADWEDFAVLRGNRWRETRD